MSRIVRMSRQRIDMFAMLPVGYVEFALADLRRYVRVADYSGGRWLWPVFSGARNA